MSKKQKIMINRESECAQNTWSSNPHYSYTPKRSPNTEPTHSKHIMNRDYNEIAKHCANSLETYNEQ